MGRIWFLAGLALRGLLLAMLVHVLRASPSDLRFAGKGIRSRALIVVPGTAAAIPLLWAATGQRRAAYPHAFDAVLLSITALDLAGNVLDLYDRHRHFDLIPHFHGTGAITVELAWLLGLPMRAAFALATAGHAVLEAQEIGSDVLFGYRNVRGWWDTAGDMAAGLAGSVAYAALYARLVRQRGREPPSPFLHREPRAMSQPRRARAWTGAGRRTSRSADRPA
jgi:hypothetical protein